MKTMVIKSNVDLFFSKYDNIYKYYILNVSNIFIRLFKKFNLPLYPFLGNWKKMVKQYDTFILFDNGYMEYVPKYIKRKNPSARIIFWYWNSLHEFNYKTINSAYVDEVWTYNDYDSKKFGYKCNTQVYSKKMKICSKKLVYDALFIGTDKGRKQNLQDLEKKLKENQIETNFKIVERKQEFVSYNDYLELLSKSKCIIDYCISNEEYGLSLRVMEALFFEKKLITNNLNVLKCDFYNPNNIFVIGKDDLATVKNFMEMPYKKIDDNIILNYDYENWLRRFDD